MQLIRITALFIMAVFYLSYFTKMLLQRRKGVKTDQIAKGQKPKKTLIIEMIMKVATYVIVPVEVISIVWAMQRYNLALRCIALCVAALGTLIFVVSMCTMQDSWRAGIPEKDRTELVTRGIYRFSRNPAFVGFDLMYIGLLVAFFHVVHLLFVVFAAIMLHLQILQEERFLTSTFGNTYTAYRSRVRRYF